MKKFRCPVRMTSGLAAGISLATCVALSGCESHEPTTAPVVSLPHPPGAALRIDQFQAAASNDKIALTVGGPVVVVHTIGSPKSTRSVLPGTVALIDIARCPDQRFVALDFYRKLWSADANGGNWEAHPIDGAWRPLALTCDAENRIWVVGSGTTIASSSDHGLSWQQRDFKEDAMFNTVQFVDRNNGFVTGEFGAVYRTVDGGVSWTAAPKISSDFYTFAALFTSPKEGYVSGLAGATLRTRDGGDSWQPLDNPGGLTQFGLARQGTTIYSVGMVGSLQRLEGNRWIALDYGPATPAYLRAITSIGQEQLLIGGAGGTLKLVPATTAAASIASIKVQ